MVITWDTCALGQQHARLRTFADMQLPLLPCLLTGPVLCMQVLHPERVHEHEGMCAVVAG